MFATTFNEGAIWRTLTKERQAWCNLQVKLCDPYLSALRLKAAERRYINTLPFLFSFPNRHLASPAFAPRHLAHSSQAYQRIDLRGIVPQKILSRIAPELS